MKPFITVPFNFIHELKCYLFWFFTLFIQDLPTHDIILRSNIKAPATRCLLRHTRITLREPNGIKKTDRQHFVELSLPFFGPGLKAGPALRESGDLASNPAIQFLEVGRVEAAAGVGVGGVASRCNKKNKSFKKP